MTAEQLLQPRFEVIANFPGNTLPIGCNIEQIHLKVIDMNLYPQLFHKLNWWENRNVEDMPKKLMCKAIPRDTEVIEIEELDMDILVGWINKKERICCNLRCFNPEYGYFPVD